MKNLYIHLALLLLSIGVFYSLGFVDKSRLEVSDANTQKAPYFSHTECYYLDGGSIEYKSFIYSAFESRRLEHVEEEGVGVVGVWAGYQGYTWTWHHLNVLWVVGLFTMSYIISSRWLRLRKNVA